MLLGLEPLSPNIHFFPVPGSRLISRIHQLDFQRIKYFLIHDWFSAFVMSPYMPFQSQRVFLFNQCISFTVFKSQIQTHPFLEPNCNHCSTILVPSKQLYPRFAFFVYLRLLVYNYYYIFLSGPRKIINTVFCLLMSFEAIIHCGG